MGAAARADARRSGLARRPHLARGPALRPLVAARRRAHPSQPRGGLDTGVDLVGGRAAARAACSGRPRAASSSRRRSPVRAGRRCSPTLHEHRALPAAGSARTGRAAASELVELTARERGDASADAVEFDRPPVGFREVGNVDTKRRRPGLLRPSAQGYEGIDPIRARSPRARPGRALPLPAPGRPGGVRGRRSSLPAPGSSVGAGRAPGYPDELPEFRCGQLRTRAPPGGPSSRGTRRFTRFGLPLLLVAVRQRRARGGQGAGDSPSGWARSTASRRRRRPLLLERLKNWMAHNNASDRGRPAVVVVKLIGDAISSVSHLVHRPANRVHLVRGFLGRSRRTVSRSGCSDR